MTKRTLLIAIPAIAIVANGAGYVIVSKVREPARGVTAITTAAVLPVLPTGTPQPRTLNIERDDGQKEKEEIARAQKEAGLTALEAGDYDKAFVNFTVARALLGDRAHVGELLRVTSELRSQPAEPRTRGTGSSRKYSASRSVTRTSTAPLAVVREATPPETSQIPVAAPSGLLKDGATATLLKDLSAERGSEAPRRASITAEAPPAKEEPSRSVTPPPATAPPTTAVTVAMSAPAKPAPPIVSTSRAVAGPIAPPAGPSSGMGTLSIASPGLYGVVWINGRPRGYPPLEVSDLPAGTAKIEVRVNGVARRSSTVVVKPDLTTTVKLRSQDSAP